MTDRKLEEAQAKEARLNEELKIIRKIIRKLKDIQALESPRNEKLPL